MTRLHRGHPVPSHGLPAGGGFHHAWDDRLRSFRHRAGAFALIDHEAMPAAIVSLTIGSAVLVTLAVLEGRAAATTASDRPSAIAWIALLCLLAALAAAVDELVAWALARPVGRELARAAAAIEGARGRVARLDRLVPPEDTDLAAAATRVGQAVDHLAGRVDDAAGALAAFACLPDPETRAGRLRLLREEAQRIVEAAEAVDGALHLLLWIDACPWSSARADALGRLKTDLDTAERLVTGTARI
ncbi:MAG: hypothetical protein U0237_20845 [Thermoleophilia bacterium]